MKLKINNDDTYQESLSKVIVIKDFIEKINVKNVKCYYSNWKKLLL